MSAGLLPAIRPLDASPWRIARAGRAPGGATLLSVLAHLCAGLLAVVVMTPQGVRLVGGLGTTSGLVPLEVAFVPAEGSATGQGVAQGDPLGAPDPAMPALGTPPPLLTMPDRAHLPPVAPAPLPVPSPPGIRSLPRETVAVPSPPVEAPPAPPHLVAPLSPPDPVAAATVEVPEPRPAPVSPLDPLPATMAEAPASRPEPVPQLEPAAVAMAEVPAPRPEAAPQPRTAPASRPSPASPRSVAAPRRPGPVNSGPANSGAAGAGEATPTAAAGTAGAPLGFSPPLITAARFRRPPRPPDYPPRAIDLDLHGTVLIRALLDPEGDPREVRVHRSSGHALLDHAAVAAVSRWAFEPAARDGLRIPAWVEVPVHFRLH